MTTARSAVPATRKTSAVAKKAPASVPAKVPAKKAAAQNKAEGPALSATRQESLLARVEGVRMAQRGEGNFDCFGRAVDGYCDQGDCLYHAECLSVSQMLHSL